MTAQTATILPLHPLTDDEWVAALAWMRVRWPGSEAWRPATIEAYRNDLAPFSYGQVMRALERYYKRGRVTPPNAGQVLLEIRDEGEQAVQEAAVLEWPIIPLADEVEDFGRRYDMPAAWWDAQLATIKRQERMDAAFTDALLGSGGDVTAALAAAMRVSREDQQQQPGENL